MSAASSCSATVATPSQSSRAVGRRRRSQRKAALKALSKGKVRAEVVAFKSPESNGDGAPAVRQGRWWLGGQRQPTGQPVADAFTAAARTLESQALIDDPASRRCHRRPETSW